MGKLVIIAKNGVISLVVLVGLVLLGLSLPIGGRRAMSVQTGSMEPNIKIGSSVFIRSVPAENIVVGDVITYINPTNKSQTITHRVVQIINSPSGSRQFITKGDANYSSDQPISEKQVVGKVNWTVPYLGGLRDFIYTWPGLILLVYIPALTILISEIRRLAAYYKAIQPYMAPIMLARLKAAKRRHVPVGKISIFALFLGFFTTFPVYAALQSQATMTGNTISTAAVIPPDEPGDVVLQRLKFACSSSNTAELNKVPSVRIYNHGHAPASIAGWYVEGDNGRLFTIPPDTTLANNVSYTVDADFPAGIEYDGDFLQLFDASGTEIDGLSWGNDSSQLSPALPSGEGDIRFHRSPPISGPSTSANDWDVIDGGGCSTGQF